jgi:tripartite-type tricarboxylate transporter receptor subunit TctC
MAFVFCIMGSVVTSFAFPDRPIKIIIPFAPGGTTDTVFRTVQPFLEKEIGGKVIIVNTSGAGGTVGTQQAIDAKPDGYTIGTLQTNTMIAPAVGLGKYKKGDYVPIVSIGDMPLTIAVKGDGPYKDLNDFKAAALKNPGKISVAMGVGTLAHFVAQKTANALGADLKLVNAGGGAKKKAAVLGGHVDALIDPPPGVLGAHRAGQLRVIGIFGPKRLETMPDVPTAKEMGIDLIAYQTKGFFYPKGVPPERAKIVAEAMCRLNDNEDLQKRLRNLSVIWSCKYGEKYYKYIDDIRTDVRALAKQMGY